MKELIKQIVLLVCIGIIFSCSQSDSYDFHFNYVDFEDDAFQAWCIESFDLDGDGELSFRELFLVTEIDVPSSYKGVQINSLKGVENFPYLEKLTCANNFKITALNLNKCIYLKEVDCSSCNISSLEIKKCTLLESLNCCNNVIKTLDISSFGNLQYLNCIDNKISSLDFSNALHILEINCGGNLLKELDVLKCEKLEILAIEENAIEFIDLSNNNVLKALICYSNKLIALDIYSPVIEYLSCAKNKMEWLLLTNKKQLQKLFCQNNSALTVLGLIGCDSLKILDCHSGNLFSLDASDCTLLEQVDCSYNELTSAKFNTENLVQLFAHTNQLITLNIASSPNIRTLSYYQNNLSAVYVNDLIDITNLINAKGENIDLEGGNKSLLRHISP